MKKRKIYYNTKFSGNIIKSAYDLFKIKANVKKAITNLFVLEFEDEEWTYDSFDEFLADYSKAKSFLFAHIEENSLIIKEAVQQLASTNI